MKSIIKKFVTAMVVPFILAVMPASAGPSDWVVTGAHVTFVEGTNVPAIVDFGIDQNAGSASQCAAGHFVDYAAWAGAGTDTTSQQANVKAIYALLLTAKLTGQTVTIYGSNTADSSGRCQAFWVMLQ